SGCPGEQRLRRLWRLRRGGPCRGAVPLVLSRRDRAKPRLDRSHHCVLAQGRVVALARPRATCRRPAGRGRMSTAPIKILIAAMGGEGGGVLTDWIVGAARAEGLAVQATSIPGVAQRTGATTYYIEIVPPLGHRAAGRSCRFIRCLFISISRWPPRSLRL